MQATASFGSERKFELRQAILIYEEPGRSAAAATVHKIELQDHVPVILPGQPITLTGLETLANALGKRIENTLLPERILSITMAQMTWWCPAARRRIWFKPTDSTKDAAALKKLNGKFVQHPPLLFIATSHSLRVLALADSSRPNARTKVFRAPYFNLDANGAMCAGTAKLPKTFGPSAMEAYEQAFFNSAFSHSNWGHQLTRHPQGHAGLWAEMAERKSEFPTRYLVGRKQTVAAAINSQPDDDDDE
jgi:PRTRC genetic system protein B